MTYLKTALIASAAIALTATPALAGEKMHKDHMKTTAQSTSTHNAVANLSAADRMIWETKIKASMSDQKKAKWSTYSEADQKAWMDKKIAKKMMKSNVMMENTTATSVSYQGAEAMKRNDTIGEILQADGDAYPEADRKLLMSNGDQMKKSVLIAKETDKRAANNAIVVPTVDSNALTTVSCPVGTTAQPDMTCHVTGNYDPTS